MFPRCSRILVGVFPRMLYLTNTGPISLSRGGATRQHFRRGAGLDGLPYLIAGRAYWKGCQTLLDYLQCDGRKALPDTMVENGSAGVG